jgi:hypothetical protein
MNTPLESRIEHKKEAIESLVSTTPKRMLLPSLMNFNDFDNYGKTQDPETEWNNWVNWEQDPHPFGDSDD